MTHERDVRKVIRAKAHDIRNPISVIHGFLEACDNLVKTRDEQEYLKAAKVSMKRLMTHANDLSAIAHEFDLDPQDETLEILSTEAVKMTPALDLTKSNVLIVDDDPEMQVQWKMVLKGTPLKYIGMDSGEKLLASHVDYDKIAVAVVDYEFDNSSLNGFDVIEFLKRKKVKTVHLCTGLYQNIGVREQARLFGVTSIIGKPLPQDISRIFS